MPRLLRAIPNLLRNLLPTEVPPGLPEGILRHRCLILALLLLLTAASVYGIFQLRADFSFETIFLSEDEEAVFFEEFKKRFEESSRDIIVPLKGEDLFQPEGLVLVQRLTEALEEVDGIEKVVNILNAPHIEGTSDGIRIEPLAEQIPEEPSEVQALRSRALASRLFHRWLISEDGTTLALFAHLAPWVQTEKDKRPVVAAVRATADRIVDRRFPVYYSGIPTIQKEYTDPGAPGSLGLHRSERLHRLRLSLHDLPERWRSLPASGRRRHERDPAAGADVRVPAEDQHARQRDPEPRARLRHYGLDPPDPSVLRGAGQGALEEGRDPGNHPPVGSRLLHDELHHCGGVRVARHRQNPHRQDLWPVCRNRHQ